MRRPRYGKVFWGNQIKGKKGWTQRPLTVPLTCALKEMLLPMPRKGGKDGGQRGNEERLREGKEGEIE